MEEDAWEWENVGKLAVGVAHDFNNVLASISGYAELILVEAGEGKADRSSLDFARSILEAASIGQSTVKELQGLVRARHQIRETLDMHQVLGRAITMVKGAMGGKIALATDFQAGSRSVIGCRGLLHNVFINLFLNARDAMPEGGRLSVGTRNREGWIEISVEDTGTGMTEEVRRGLFRRFHTTKGRKGNGLGLNNALATVESHGGRIDVDTDEGRGTAFRVRLPLASPAAGKTPIA